MKSKEIKKMIKVWLEEDKFKLAKELVKDYIQEDKDFMSKEERERYYIESIVEYSDFCSRTSKRKYKDKIVRVFDCGIIPAEIHVETNLEDNEVLAHYYIRTR